MSETIPKKQVFVEIVEHIIKLSKTHASFAWSFFLITGFLTVTFSEFVDIYWSKEYGSLSSLVTFIIYIFHIAASGYVSVHIDESFPNKWFTKILSFCPIILAFASIIMPAFIQNYYGPCKPGAFFERTEYTGKFLVNVFTTNSKSKNHRLPALIEASYQSEEYDERRSFFKVYTLKYIEWPDGKKSFFNNAILNLREEVHAIDKEGQEWYVELTDSIVKE